MHNESGDQAAGEPNAPSKRRLPRWLKQQVPNAGAFQETRRVLGDLALETVCENARCPNRTECYGHHTATFMILGNRCTRGCPFCAVQTGHPEPVDEDEPRRVALAAERLGLSHVVITSVCRDDLEDGGAAHFVETIQSVRARTGATIEVLPSDFGGNFDAVRTVAEARPDVYNYNCETVPRLFAAVRGPRPRYDRTLEIFRVVARAAPMIRLKTGLMLGVGETEEELLETLADLHDAGCRLLTMGQYLAPSDDHLPVERYVAPEEFDRLGAMARRLGYDHVASGPLVRSSYFAHAMVVDLVGDGERP